MRKMKIFSSSFFFLCGVLEHGIVDIFVCLEGNWIKIIDFHIYPYIETPF